MCTVGARFVDQTGQLKPNSVQASRLEFDNKAESMGESVVILPSIICQGNLFTYIPYCSISSEHDTQFSSSWDARQVSCHTANHC